MTVELGELEQLWRSTSAAYEEYFSEYSPSTHYQRAACTILNLAKSRVQSISILISKSLTVDAAILVRSLMNLYWNFLFMVGAKQLGDGTGRWQFEDKPAETSHEFQRACRFLSWHWAYAYRSANRTDKVVKLYEELKKEFGFKSDDEVPKDWYQERANGIFSIKDVARFIGAERQYDEDYKHLSGMEHSDVTSAIVHNFNEKGDVGYRRFIYFKGIQFFGQMLEMTIGISGRKMNEALLSLVNKMGAVSKVLYDEIRKIEAE